MGDEVHEHDFLTVIIVVFLIIIMIAVAMASPVFARDDGRYAGMDPKMRAWFDSLASGKGSCCSQADGLTVQDVDWDVQDGHYRVRLHGEWIVVPDNAVMTEPNLFGQSIVWPYLSIDGTTQIRCFLPASGA